MLKLENHCITSSLTVNPDQEPWTLLRLFSVSQCGRQITLYGTGLENLVKPRDCSGAVDGEIPINLISS